MFKTFKNTAFTMAEILLSLTIIGVVAAITLPSLTGNINERTWNTQRKALHTRMVQAVAMMNNLNNYGKYSATSSEDDQGYLTLTVSEDTAAETFVTAGLSKVLKLNNVCDNEHLADCGLPTNITAMNGLQKALPKSLNELNSFFGHSGLWNQDSNEYGYSQIDTKAAAFETANGESVVVYYNPHCIDRAQAEGRGSYSGKTQFLSQLVMCANFVFDMNGNKGPNTVGKDIGFMSAIYSTEPQVAMPVLSNSAIYSSNGWNDATRYCREQEGRLPSLEESMSINYNTYLLGFNDQDKIDPYWTNASNVDNISQAYAFIPSYGDMMTYSKTTPLGALCVKR